MGEIGCMKYHWKKWDGSMILWVYLQETQILKKPWNADKSKTWHQMTVTHTILNQRRNNLNFAMQVIARGSDWKYERLLGEMRMNSQWLKLQARKFLRNRKMLINDCDSSYNSQRQSWFWRGSDWKYERLLGEMGARREEEARQLLKWGQRASQFHFIWIQLERCANVTKGAL